MAYCTTHGAEDVPGCPECEGDPAAIREREDIERDRNAQIAAGVGGAREARPSVAPAPKAVAPPSTGGRPARKPAARRPSKPKAKPVAAVTAVPKNTAEVGANAAAEERLAQDE